MDELRLALRRLTKRPAAAIASIVTATARRDVTVRARGTADDARREILSAIRQLDPVVTPGPMLS